VVASVRATMGADLPAILITGDTDPKLLRSMADRGIIVLHKPLDMEVLQTALKDLTPLAG
jgi:two-component system, sensor histidine kinase